MDAQEERGTQRGVLRLDPGQRPGRPALVEIGLRPRLDLVPVLDVELPPAPLGHRVVDDPPRLVGLVVDEERHVGLAHAEVGPEVEVTALVRLAQVCGQALSHEGELPQVQRGREPEVLHRTQRPLHLERALLVERDEPLAVPRGHREVPGEVADRGVSEGDHRLAVTGRLVREQPPREVDPSGCSGARPGTARGDEDRLEHERAQEPLGLARAQAGEQVLGLELRSAHVVDDGEAGGGRPADVDAREGLGRDGVRLAEAEAQAPQREEQAEQSTAKSARRGVAAMSSPTRASTARMTSVPAST